MNWLRKMMTGRYGPDQLSTAFLITAMALTLLGSILRFPVLSILSYLPLLAAILRIFSKNIGKRYQENVRFLSVWHRITGWFRGLKAQAAQRKTHRFYHCPKCKHKLRVPRGKGKIKIRCPKCGEEFIKKT